MASFLIFRAFQKMRGMLTKCHQRGFGQRIVGLKLHAFSESAEPLGSDQGNIDQCPKPPGGYVMQHQCIGQPR
ncbi:hypothetical protein DXO181_18860 [Xanthomonas oryzae pv. oryzae]|nr:hypothetical protein DXO181_18860 [Xanthomonas oryzae pv. oryzae]OLI14133.1 hypothetical protein DXO226_18025 [Xanthomonas oryzae pv. oryzae]OLI16749.1 hypothetical protein IXO90_19295 [Xanthomonas oryzae pv. oryzae]OLI23561.1 hypothetical protein IXO93_19610 [Xanthomonas oryzae pv. oryzae]OLI66549.1 hypothetical protein IXO159_08075 [Xanthomonas oryzae pv. oryzae]